MPKDKPIASLEAEQAVLGAILIEAKQIHEIIELIRPEDFYRDAHGKIFQAMLDLLQSDTTIDFTTVSGHLRDKEQLDGIGGIKFLMDLAEQTPFATKIKDYGRIVHDKSTLRRLYAAALTIIKDCQNSTGIQTGDVLESALGRVAGIIEGARGKGRKNIKDKVKDWALVTAGDFMVTDCYRDLGLVTSSDKNSARQVLVRLTSEGLLANCGTKRGCYRTIEPSEEIDWMSADLENTYDISWPFDLEQLVTLYPGNIVILAGAQNAGKTAFLLNLIKLNQAKKKVVYFNSESGPEEMKLRLSKFDDISLDQWRFKALERSANFSEAIFPDRLNIIDYMELTDNFYLVGGELKKIHDRLKKGVAVIALQKKAGQELGRGAEFALEKPRLYLSMDSGKLKIVKGKNWASMDNPNGMTFKFKLVQGCKFVEFE